MNLEELFKTACLDELQAIKPGNVHVFADGHDMTVQDFIKSADVASAVIAQAGLSLGERILQSVQATHDAVHTNTNLGMILLCAPLIHAKLNANNIGLRANIHAVISDASTEDAAACFAAIRLANPGGLGESEQHDVYNAPSCTLLEAMQAAETRDLIARQYSNDFADIFDFGLISFEQAISRWQNNSWATTYVHLSFLANYLDSHIVRKYGETMAEQVQDEAKAHLKIFAEIKNPKTYLGKLLQWDSDLKVRKINPGTCADLTVATLFVAKLKDANGYA